jgi:hypothetical protein
MENYSSHYHFCHLLVRLLRDGKGEHVALLLRALGKDRANWITARKAIGAASTLLIAFDPSKYDASLGETMREIIYYVHKAGFTSEELIPLLELLD